jgi:2'-phosphotransferase
MINPEKLLHRLSPNELRALPCIVHGTYLEAWHSIRDEGLKKMNRTHIHFAAGMPKQDGVISGMRKSCTVYIYLDVSKCASAAESGVIVFFTSDNGVILTDGVDGVLPTEYFSNVVDSSGKVLLENNPRNDSTFT